MDREVHDLKRIGKPDARIIRRESTRHCIMPPLSLRARIPVGEADDGLSIAGDHATKSRIPGVTAQSFDEPSGGFRWLTVRRPAEGGSVNLGEGIGLLIQCRRDDGLERQGHLPRASGNAFAFSVDAPNIGVSF
jgi:hypothetical protein